MTRRTTRDATPTPDHANRQTIARQMPIGRARGAAGTVRRDVLVPAALAYAARGWHVFPLRADDKRPAFPDHAQERCAGTDPRCARARRHVGWEERATTDPARIRRAWSSAPYGIGIACGPSGLVVIDLDIPKPDPADPTGRTPEPPEPYRIPGVRDGADVFTLVCEHAGQPVPWDTFVVNTASGGTHLYYAAPAGPGEALRNTAGALGWLIDTRAGGGYVVAPPSTVTARSYTIASDADTPVAPLPAWLTQRLTPSPLPPQEPITVALRSVSDARRRAYLESAIGNAVTAVLESADRQHNRALYGAAVQLGQLIAGGALPEQDAAAALQAAGEAVGQSRSEAAKTIASGFTAGARRPRSLAEAAKRTTAQKAA